MNLFLLKAIAAAVLAPMWSDRVRVLVGQWLTRLGGVRATLLFATWRFVPAVLALLVFRLKVPEDSIEWVKIVGASHQVSPYSFGFDHLLAALWSVVPSPLGFVFAFIALEVVAFRIFWSAVAGRLREPVVVGLLAFWVVNPISLFHVALNGQDETLILLAWCLTLWMALNGHARAGGLMVAASIVCTKILGGVTFLPLLTLPTRKVAWAAATCLVALWVIVTGCVILGVPLLGFLSEVTYLTSGNIWVVPKLLGVTLASSFTQVEFGLAAVASLGTALYLAVRPLAELLPQALRLTGTVGMVFLLLSPKSETAWLLMFLPGVLFLVENTKGWTHRFLLYGFLPVCTFETSLWWYFDQGATISDVAWGRPVMLVVEAILLGGYGVLVRHGLRLREVECPRRVSVATFAMPQAVNGSHP